MRSAVAVPLAAIVGLAAGALLVTLLNNEEVLPVQHEADVIVRDISDIQTITMAEAELHREDRFDRIKSIEDTLSLPGDFSQTEALYVLAGRSDSIAVQDLIDQANRIADPTDRNAALSILFLRLAELDPQSALTMSRMRTYTNSRNLEAVIWRTWSKLDLDAALEAAKKLSNPTERGHAAQTMLAAYGYTGNATTARIEAELDVQASASSRGRYLISLADRSMNEAIDYVNALPLAQQREAVQWLASYAGQRNPSAALGYADLIENPRLRDQFRNALSNSMAALEPERVLAEMPASGLTGNQSGRYYAAMRALAETDIDKALLYYENIQSRQARQMFGATLATALAKKDPARALDWARSQDGGGQPTITMSVLQQIAVSDPAYALAEAEKLSSRHWRQQTVSSVLSTMAQSDPEGALAYLADISNANDRQAATTTFVRQWANYDPKRAIDWIVASDLPGSREMLRSASYSLISNDVDAAIRLLPRVDEDIGLEWRTTITHTLASQRGLAEAQRFVERYRGEPGFDQLQTALIGGVAQQDIYAAHTIVAGLPSGKTRDQGYAQLIGQHLYSDPQEAASWLSAISDDNVRMQSTGQVLQQWMRHDAAAATRWIQSQAAGRYRDQAIVSAVSSAGHAPEQLERLIALIDDPQFRSQARIQQVWQTAAQDPAAARRLLNTLDLPEEQRRQIESQIARY